MRRLLPFLTLLTLVIALSIGGVVQSDAATSEPLPEGYVAGATQVDGGVYFTCARLADGTVRCWGDNEVGQLGNGTHDDADLPTTVLGPDGSSPLTGVRQISTGDRHACARLADGTVACWGRNVYGQLGDGSATERTHAVVVHGVGNVGTLTGISQISLGAFTSCARTTTGQARCWGDGDHGQLGHGTESGYQPTPVVVQNRAGTGPLTGVAQVSLGANTACARLQSGEARCWGQNFEGQIGDGTTTDRARPRLVRTAGGGALRGIRQIAPNFTNTCAIVTGGQVRCWGRNYHGTLGTGTTDSTDHLHPEVVVNPSSSGPLTGARRVAVGDEHTCVALGNGQVRCWGRNHHGQLGDGTFDARSRPTPVRAVGGTGRLGSVTSLGVGDSHTCARLSSGQLRCWGYDTHGELGDGGGIDKTLPVVVQG